MERLTHRDRFLRTLRYQPVDFIPDFEFGYWEQTTERWFNEGLQIPGFNRRAIGDRAYRRAMVQRYFQTDDTDFGPGLPGGLGYMPFAPAYETKVLEDQGQYEIYQEEDGAISRRFKPEYGASMPQFLRYPIESRADWEHLRDERLDPQHPDRQVKHIDAWVRRLNARDYPLTIGLGSLYGWPRSWMGVERFSMMLFDDRNLIEEIMEHSMHLALLTLEKWAGHGLVIDEGSWWEDMCYKSGPLLSPRMFREMMLPRYKRVVEFARREFGIQFHDLDSDGNIRLLIPLWLEAGINVLFPFEVPCNDAWALRQEFGRTLRVRGAFDKRALAEGPGAIDAEFARLKILHDDGGFIPQVDHSVPHDVALENYLYYRRRKCEFLGKPWQEPALLYKPGYQTAWRLLGPLAPEQESGLATSVVQGRDSEGVPAWGQDDDGGNWRKYTGANISGYVDLEAALALQVYEVAYAACGVYSPDEREAWLELGSDGSLQVWLNREEVHRSHEQRVARPRQNLESIHLRQGWNTVRLRVAPGEYGCGFYFRLTDDQGRIWSDVAYRTS